MEEEAKQQDTVPVEVSPSTTPEVVAAPAATAPKKKKKKKSKKKKGTGNAVNNSQASNGGIKAPTSMNIVDASGRWEVVFTQEKGRGVIAKQEIPPGETVVEGESYTWGLLNDYSSSLCDQCLQPASESNLGCGTCKVAYCSEGCKRAAAKLHQIECPIYAKIPSVAIQTSVDDTLLRIATRAICRSALDLTTRKEYEEFLGLLHHAEKYQGTNDVKQAGAALASLFPSSTNVTPELFTEVCCRINTNGHVIAAPSYQGSVGLSIFPRLALLNHSCEPTCGVSNVGTKMFVRTIKKISKGEELTLSYVDLYQSRQKRIDLLRRTKHFECKCERCSTPLEESKDRFLDGLSCSKKGCKGVLRTTPPTRKQQQPQQEIGGAGRGKGKGKGKAKGKGQPQQQAQQQKLQQEGEKEKQPQQGGGDTMWCEECGQAEKEVTELRKKFEEELGAALEGIETLEPPGVPKKVEQLEKILKDTRLCPQHALIFNAHIVLVNLFDQMDDEVNAIRHCKEVISAMEEVFPPNSEELSNHYFHLGALYDNLARPGVNKALWQRYKKAAKESFQKCVAIRTVWYGPQHSETQEAASRLS